MADIMKTEWFQSLQHLTAPFSALTWLDYTFLIVIFIGLVIGSRKGFANFFGKSLLLLIPVPLTHEFAEPVAKSFPFQAPIAAMLMHALTFVAFAIASLFIIGIMLKVIGKVLQVKFADLFEKIGGSILGCVYFVLLFSFISNFILIFPGDWLHTVYEKEAPVGKFLMKFSPKVHEKINQTIPPEWRGQKITVHGAS